MLGRTIYRNGNCTGVSQMQISALILVLVPQTKDKLTRRQNFWVTVNKSLMCFSFRCVKSLNKNVHLSGNEFSFLTLRGFLWYLNSKLQFLQALVLILQSTLHFYLTRRTDENCLFYECVFESFELYACSFYGFVVDKWKSPYLKSY